MVKNNEDKKVIPGEKVLHAIEVIEKDIRSGSFGERGVMPTREQMWEMYGVKSDVLNRAMAHLRASGLITLKGKQVVPNPEPLHVPALTPSFDGFLEEHGKEPDFRNIDITILEADEILAEKFQIKIGTSLIRRTRLQGEKRNNKSYWYRLARTYYLYDLASEFIQTMQQPRFNTTAAIAEKTGMNISVSDIDIIIRFPNEQERDLLGISYETPVGVLIRVCYSPDNVKLMLNEITSPAHYVRYKLPNVPTNI